MLFWLSFSVSLLFGFAEPVPGFLQIYFSGSTSYCLKSPQHSLSPSIPIHRSSRWLKRMPAILCTVCYNGFRTSSLRGFSCIPFWNSQALHPGTSHLSNQPASFYSFMSPLPKLAINSSELPSCGYLWELQLLRDSD